MVRVGDPKRFIYFTSLTKTPVKHFTDIEPAISSFLYHKNARMTMLEVAVVNKIEGDPFGNNDRFLVFTKRKQYPLEKDFKEVIPKRRLEQMVRDTQQKCLKPRK